jgi:hypothetical protein
LTHAVELIKELLGKHLLNGVEDPVQRDGEPLGSASLVRIALVDGVGDPTLGEALG